jgi:hypothetical protein
MSSRELCGARRPGEQGGLEVVLENPKCHALSKMRGTFCFKGDGGEIGCPVFGTNFMKSVARVKRNGTRVSRNTGLGQANGLSCVQQ